MQQNLDLAAKRQNINQLLMAQTQHQQAKNQTMLGQIAAKNVSGGKEAVLRQLLETQDSYIHELEAKCKALTAQVLSNSPSGGSLGAATTRHDDGSVSHSSTFAIDLDQLETSQEATGAKIDRVVNILTQAFATGKKTQSTDTEFSHPVARHALGALQIIRNAANLDEKVQQQRLQQHASLIAVLQARSSKEREDQKHLFEKNEQILNQKILALEQEIIVMRQHVRNGSREQATKDTRADLNTRVLEEMQNLEERYRQNEDELRRANKELRRDLAETQRDAREINLKWQTLRDSINVTETGEYACIKRIEGQMRVIFRDFKSAEQRLEALQRSHINDDDSTKEEDPKLSKLLRILNLQLQSLDDELEAEFDAIVPPMQTGALHRQEHAGQTNLRQLQALLGDAQAENAALRDQLNQIQHAEQEQVQNVWLTKLELLDGEKRGLQSELINLVDISSMREKLFSAENESLNITISQLQAAATERESYLQLEISALRKQIASLFTQMKQQGIQMSQLVQESQQPDYRVATEVTIADSQEINLLRCLNENLENQLKEANLQLQRPPDCIQKQNQVGFIYSKLEDRLQQILNALQECLDNLEISSAKKWTLNKQTNKRDEQSEQAPIVAKESLSDMKQPLHVYDRELFEAREQIAQLSTELDQAKVYLVQHLTAQNSVCSIGMTGGLDMSNGGEYLADMREAESGESNDMVNILVSKFSQEIERLKEDNALLKQARDNVTTFYKDEFTKLWQKSEEQHEQYIIQVESLQLNEQQYLQLSQSKRPQEASSDLCESQEIIAELRERLGDVHEWIFSLRQNEVQALHDKIELLRSKQQGQTFAPSKVTSSGRGSRKMLKQQTLASRESYPSIRSTQQTLEHHPPQQQPDSVFSFNCTPVQQKLLYEEVEILREQVSSTLLAYNRATHQRDQQSLVLSRERKLLQLRETVLDAALSSTQEIVLAQNDHDSVKKQNEQKTDLVELDQVKQANKALSDRLLSEKQVSDKELQQVQGSYQHKFVQLKEQETLLELQLAQLDKELKVAQDSQESTRDQKEQLVQSLNGEIVLLKKFANQRQAELLETRRQVTLFYKKTKETVGAREQEFQKVFKDQLGSHVKVLEIECKKLQKIAIKYEK